MPAARRRRLGAAVSSVVALVLLPACSVLPGPPQSTPRGPASVPAAPTATPSLPARGRPVQPVPDVTPAGFAAPPPGAGQERYREQSLTWEGCAQGLQCASVLAPLDYDDPDGSALTLALAKRPATAEPRLGTLFINPGGPGGSGRSFVGYFDAEGLDRYDVVGWDPRGVGGSTPVSCYGSADYDRYLAVDDSPDDAAEAQALLAESHAFGRACLAGSGPLLEHISTATTVADLDLLRTLVGDARLQYFGASYGTRIGALYAQLHPGTVGRMVLDGAVDVSGEEVSQLEGFERALGHFASWAAAAVDQDRPLGTTQQAVLDRISALLTALDQTPLPVAGRQLSQQQGVGGVLNSLYGREEWPALLRALATAGNGDGRGLLTLADQGNYRYPDGSYGQINAAFPAIRCLDSRDTSVRAAERADEREARRAPVLGSLTGPDLVCPLWPVAPAPRQPRITAAGAAPIVVLGTTGDPATPYENAEGMAEQLESGVLVSLEGEGHTAYSQSACIRSLVDAYLVDGEVPAEGARCSS